MICLNNKIKGLATVYYEDLVSGKRSVADSGTMKSKFLNCGNYERYVAISLAIVEYKYRVKYGQF